MPVHFEVSWLGGGIVIEENPQASEVTLETALRFDKSFTIQQCRPKLSCLGCESGQFLFEMSGFVAGSISLSLERVWRRIILKRAIQPDHVPNKDYFEHAALSFNSVSHAWILPPRQSRFDGIHHIDDETLFIHPGSGMVISLTVSHPEN
jgi:hypothetical protein